MSVWVWILWGVVLCLLFLAVGISFIFRWAIYKRHRAHRDADIALYQNNKSIPPEMKRAYASLVERRYSTIQNYFTYQIVNKVFGLVGVLYSVLGFGLGIIPTNDTSNVPIKTLCAVVSFISIICVIIALYLSPTKRVAEYIDAWRRYDQKIFELSGKPSIYNEPKKPRFKLDILSGKAMFHFSKKTKKKLKTSEVTNSVAKFIFETESGILSERE